MVMSLVSPWVTNEGGCKLTLAYVIKEANAIKMTTLDHGRAVVMKASHKFALAFEMYEGCH